VSVALKSDDDKVGFHVLKESKSGETTVTLIYDGVLDGSGTVYDETRPDDNHDATSVLEQSVVGQALYNVVYAEDAKWRVENVSLLSSDDLTNLGITKNSNGVYEITEKYSFLAPIKVAGLSSEMYNYWTQIQDTSAATTSMYCVTYNEDRTESTGVWGTLTSNDITSITNNSKCAIRPVVVIDKAYILCNNTKTPPNVETGISNYIIPLAGVLLITCGAIVLTKKKTVFKKI
jgi:hypothetical protein